MPDGAFRSAVISLAGIAVLLPIALIAYQSVLSGPFFAKDVTFDLGAFGYVLRDPGFWYAVRNSLIVATGMTCIAVPLGAALAFIVARSDLPGRAVLEPLLILPIVISPVVLALGYVVSAGPVGFYSVLVKNIFGTVPWHLYSPASLIVIAGLSHVPYAYLYTSSALRGMSSDVEEAARIAGAGPLRVAIDVSLPIVRPALLFSSVLIFFAGVEMFGLALLLGDPGGFELLSIYLLKLTMRLGMPSYQLMAVVCMFMIGMTFPLVILQRHFLTMTDRYVAVRGKAARLRRLPLGQWGWVATGLIVAWLFVACVVPVSGVVLRAFVTRWGPHVNLLDVLTLRHFQTVLLDPTLLRGIINSILIGTLGGALAVACYTAISLCTHRRLDGWSRFVDYLVLVPRAVPGLLMGLAFLWVFLFFPPLRPLRSTLFSIWIAYAVVWLAYGVRVVSSSLLQVSRELEEAGRTLGAGRGRVLLDVTVPLARYGLLASWLLIFLMFEREYATGVYLLTPGTEVIGSLLVSLAETGALDVVAALSVVNIILVGSALALALRFGVKLHD